MIPADPSTSVEGGDNFTMAGPVSAPNGDKSLVIDIVKRRSLAAKGKLRTGKTK